MGTSDEQSQKWEQEKSGIANPASVHCSDQGHYITFKETKEGTMGICNFNDSSWCEEWAYFRNECQPGTNLTKCGDRFWGKTICTEGYDPVCAKLNTSERKTFDNACTACIERPKVLGYNIGEC